MRAAANLARRNINRLWAVRPASVSRRGDQLRAYAEIPVNNVCRVLQCKVKGEEEAVKMDALLDKAEQAMKKVPGYVGGTRLVCKSYWDYKSISIFESGDALGGYLEGDVREKELLPLLEQAKELAVDGDIKMQNFVYDEHK